MAASIAICAFAAVSAERKFSKARAASGLLNICG
jgi:hypothetical protein